MKRRKKRRKTSTNSSERRPVVSRDRRIILVNDAPLRQRAAAECRRELAQLDKARAEWQRYQQKDQPAFARWTAATFGPLLTRLRDNELLLDEQETFIEEVELEMICGDHRNPHRAYVAVKESWDHPASANDFSDASGAARKAGEFDPKGDIDDDLPAGVRRELFEEFVRCLGANPARMSKAESEEMFAAFEAAISEAAEGESTARSLRSRTEKKPEATSAEGRLKEIYRILVRRLHPDLRAGVDTAVSVIWHEVQEAYQARNLGRLETLLALTQMQDGTEGGQASLSQMRGAVGELRRSISSLQKGISEAKRESAWGFSQTQNHASLEKRIRRELEATLFQQKRVLADQRRILDEWARPRQAPAKRPKKQRGANVAGAIQADLFAF